MHYGGNVTEHSAMQYQYWVSVMQIILAYFFCPLHQEIPIAVLVWDKLFVELDRCEKDFTLRNIVPNAYCNFFNKHLGAINYFLAKNKKY